MALRIELNGQRREFAELKTGDSLQAVIEALDLKSDRIALERNGDITPRAMWPQISISDGDKLEIVHFVGGGVSDSKALKEVPERSSRTVGDHASHGQVAGDLKEDVTE